MKKLVSLLLLLTMSSPAFAGYRQPGGVRERTCYKEIYREEYIPGTSERPGRVRSWKETREVPCEGNNGHVHVHPSPDVDDNSCVEGSVLGGIAGAAAGAALSRDEGMLIGIPLGIVTGAMVGCQIDGG